MTDVMRREKLIVKVGQRADEMTVAQMLLQSQLGRFLELG